MMIFSRHETTQQTAVMKVNTEVLDLARTVIIFRYLAYAIKFRDKKLKNFLELFVFVSLLKLVHEIVCFCLCLRNLVFILQIDTRCYILS